MSVGRNDPCPCGSGKKHKRCCGAPVHDDLAGEASRVRSILEKLEPRILRHARDVLGEPALDMAWDDFVLDARGVEPGGPETQLFLPWMLYRWVPSVPDRLPIPLSASFRDAHRSRLSAEEDAILAAVTSSAFSFHEVLACEPGRTLRLRDAIFESEMTLFEQSASRTLEPGDLLYARVVDFGSVGLMVGAGSVVLPPDCKVPLVKLRKKLRKEFRGIEPELPLRLTCDEPFRISYFAFREGIVSPRLPTLQNTDGDPLEPHTLVWKIESPDEAFRALAPLASVVHSEAELRQGATLDRAGRVIRTEFPWAKAGNEVHSEWTNTTLGHIVIDRSKLTIEVNSVRRADRVRAEIAQRLGGRAFGPSITRRSAEEMLRTPPERPHRSSRAPDPEADAWSASPEALEAVRQFHEAHWDSWITQRIPALGNRQPAQLVKTKEGREMVEALLRSFERHGPPPGLGPAYDFDRVRARLGLAPRRPSP